MGMIIDPYRFASAAVVTFGALVKKAADQTAADYTTATIMAFDEEVYDYGGWHDNSTNNSRLTVPSGVSRVRIFAQVGISDFSLNIQRRFDILMNGAVMTLEGFESDTVTSTTAASIFASYPIAVTPGDYFELRFKVTTDGSIRIVALETTFAIEKVE